MAVRFVIGRAGTGKTELCIREMRAEMMRDPLGGGSLLWVVPEQGTFTAERQLLTSSGGGERGGRGSFRSQVLGFRRLAMLIAGEIGILGAGGTGGVKPVDDIARMVLLEELVRREKETLTVFRAAAERPGFAKSLDATLRELRQHHHSGDSLREAAAAVEPVTARKLLDLAILLDAWSVELERTGVWDFERLMHEAALRAGEAPLVKGARVWVDAISAMSALEMRLLAALGEHAREVTVTLLADPDMPGIRDLRDSGEVGLFSRTERLYRRLVDRFREHQIRVEKVVGMRERYRFAGAGGAEVARVERELFEEREERKAAPLVVASPAAPAAPLTAKKQAKGKRGHPAQMGLFEASEETPAVEARESPGLPSDAPLHDPPSGETPLEVWTCGEPESEVRAVAGEIRRWMRGGLEGGQMRCREVAVIVPDLEGYHDALRRIFNEHGIPHFIDLRRTIAHHPLVELLRSAVAIITGRWARDDLMLYLKTGLAGVEPEEVARVENYAIEHGITHVPWQKPWTWITPNENVDEPDDRTPASLHERLQRVNAVRQKVWEDLEPFITECVDAGSFAPALRSLVARLGVEAQLSAWIASARTAGHLEQAQIHEQAAKEIDRVLALLEELFKGKSITLKDFQRVLESALEQLQLGLIPPTVDQVLISSVARSRVPEMEAVFVIGAVEGQFPKVVNEDPILSDEQRAAFNAHTMDPISEGSDRQLLEMPFLDYVALTRSRRRLIITHPVADRRGKALAPSRYLARIDELFGAGVRKRAFDRESHRQPDGIATRDDLLAGVGAWARGRLGGRLVAGEAGEDLAVMAGLYNAVAATADGEIARARGAVWKAIVPAGDPALSEDMAARLFPAARRLRLSVSQLESFAACPLRYFFQYTLKLQARAEFKMDNLDMGLWQHRILERIYRRVIAGEEGGLNWPNDRAAVARAVTEEIAGASEEMHAQMSEQTPGYGAMQTRLRRVIGIHAEADRRRARQGQMRPWAVELFFGTDYEARRKDGRLISLPVLRVPMTDGRGELLVNGKIDRVDAAGGTRGTGACVDVIDYKSGTQRTLNLVETLFGLSLQLPAYAFVMRDLAGVQPMAALYANLGLNLQKVEHGGAKQVPVPETDEFYQRVQPRGLISAGGVPLLDVTVQVDNRGESGTGKSAWYGIAFRGGWQG